jgi:site-specific DNA recombinase
MKPRDQWIPIKVPAIIEKDIFERAGAQLKKNFESLGRNKKNDYLLARRIYCVCGSRRAGEGPQHGKFLYYRCNSRVTSFPLPSKCKEKGINARIADNIVWQRIKDIMSSPELMVEQIEQWLINIKNNKPLDSTINVESTKSEIKRLQIQEDRLAKAYAQEVFSLEKFEEYVNPIRKKISEFQNQIYLANLEKTPKDEILLPSNDEIEIFAKEALEHLEGLDFPAKQAIVRQVVNRIIASRESLQVFGLISLSEIYVIFFSEYSYRWSAKRRQVHAF